jgi:hypothetical protein
LRLNFSISIFCAARLLTASLSLTFVTTEQWYHNQSLWKIGHQVCLNAVFCLSKHDQSVCVFPWGEVQVYLWILRCGNIVLLTARFLGVANFTTLNSLSLLISCKLSFPIVTLKIFFLPTFVLKSPNQMFISYLENW